MKITAAVTEAQGKDFVLQEVELASPKANEVLPVATAFSPKAKEVSLTDNEFGLLNPVCNVTGEQPPRLWTYKSLIQEPDVLPENNNGVRSVEIWTPSLRVNVNIEPSSVDPVT